MKVKMHCDRLRTQMRNRRPLLIIAFFTACLLGLLGYQLWYHLAKKGAVAAFEDPVEHYKYASLGQNPGFPYYLWVIMPRLFADRLPEGDSRAGWASFGLIEEEGRGYPIGFAKQTVGFPSLSPNCALCHTGSYRESTDSTPVVVPGAPASGLDFKAFNQFVFGCATDERFAPATLTAAIDAEFQLGWWEKRIYRYVLLPTVKRTLLEQKEAARWMDSRPDPGCGRFDAFNLFKISVLGISDDKSIGTSDFPPLWNQKAREGQFLHWNGSGNRLLQDNLMSVYPLNQGPKGFVQENFDRVHEFLAELAPPRFPFPIDESAAAAGEPLYRQHCASCHDFAGDKVGQVTPVAETGTDPEFLKMWSAEFVDRLSSIDSAPFRFPGLRRTDGYLNVPLDGCWLRAPFLHNGSVPSLWDLLQPEESRVSKFYRGSNVFDPKEVGFVTEEIVSERQTLYDTKSLGNSNLGHVYGTELSDQDKWNLIEYLKTL